MNILEMTVIKKLNALVETEPPLWAIGKNQGEFVEFARAALPPLIEFIEATKERFCRECGGAGEIRVEIGNVQTQRPCRRCGTTGHEPLSPAQQAAMTKLEEASHV